MIVVRREAAKESLSSFQHQSADCCVPGLSSTVFIEMHLIDACLSKRVTGIASALSMDSARAVIKT